MESGVLANCKSAGFRVLRSENPEKVWLGFESERGLVEVPWHEHTTVALELIDWPLKILIQTLPVSSFVTIIKHFKTLGL
jgi:hypothetical protein